MPQAHDDALRDILEDARRRLAGIRLELPDLGDGKPAPPSPSQWAAAELAQPGEAPPRPAPRETASDAESAAAPPGEAASVRPAGAEVAPLEESPLEEAPAERVASVPVETAPSPPAAPRPAFSAPPPTPSAQPALPSLWRARPVAAAAVLGLAAALTAVVLLRGGTPPAGPVAQSDDGRWFSAAEREILVFARGAEPASLPLRATWRSIAWTPGWVWGADGVSSTVERIAENGSGARSFQLDHVPSAIFARHPHLWTLDPGRRQARQYLVTESMLGTFLQPLDARRLPVAAAEGELFVEEDGRLLILERGAAVLNVVDSQNRACAVPAPAGARLVSARGRPALIVESSTGRALKALPELCRPAP